MVFRFAAFHLSCPRFQRALLAAARAAVEQEPLGIGADPLQWWKKQPVFVPLFPFIRMMLGIPASNTSAERLFSSSGFLSDGRATLHIETLEHLVVVRHFLLTVEYEAERERLIATMMQRLDEDKTIV
jgi:hypothetical protein